MLSRLIHAGAVYVASSLSDDELLDQLIVSAHIHHSIRDEPGAKALYLEWFALPRSLRRKGLGLRSYNLWEATLPVDIKLIYAHAADSGEGNTMDFWDQVGFSPVYCEETGNYEADNYMVKPVGDWQTPQCIEVEEDDAE